MFGGGPGKGSQKGRGIEGVTPVDSATDAASGSCMHGGSRGDEDRICWVFRCTGGPCLGAAGRQPRPVRTTLSPGGSKVDVDGPLARGICLPAVQGGAPVLPGPRGVEHGVARCRCLGPPGGPVADTGRWAPPLPPPAAVATIPHAPGFRLLRHPPLPALQISGACGSCEQNPPALRDCSVDLFQLLAKTCASPKAIVCHAHRRFEARSLWLVCTSRHRLPSVGVQRSRWRGGQRCDRPGKGSCRAAAGQPPLPPASPWPATASTAGQQPRRP